LIYFLPIATTLFSAFFFIELWQHWRNMPNSAHILWWMVGIFFYGAGTITESIHAVAGYIPLNFRLWYIFGALLGGAPLAQGTVYLLLSRRIANILSVIVGLAIIVGAVLILLSPLKPVTDPDAKLSGQILEWGFIRAIVPFINIYAFLFLCGGAIYSAVLYYRTMIDKSRAWGNILIAIGALLPGIGGTASKFGYIQVLYLTEFIGICLMHAGYQMMKASAIPSIYPNQR